MITVGIVGASGLVGQKAAEIVARKLPECKILLYGNQSAGQKMCLLGKTYAIADIGRLENDLPNYVLFMANEEVSKKYLPILAEKGSVCIDNSKYFRMHVGVPLVVPHINGEKARGKFIISNPNCTTIQIVTALNALVGFCPKKMTAATFQSVSGAGKDGLADLLEKRGYGKLKAFPHTIFDNIIPQIGKSLPNGHTEEEEKIKNETRKILNLPKLKVNAFCARVPVTIGHCAFVNVEFEKEIDVNAAKELLAREPNVVVADDVENGIYPMPTMFRNTNLVGIGRLHGDGAGGLNMFVVADNLIVGAADNAVKILELLTAENGETEKK